MDDFDDITCEEFYDDTYHDELERDHDEPYEPETNDNWYDEQYELDTDYL